VKRRHVHSWRLDSPHRFGAVTRYRCASCTAVYSETRPTQAERVTAMEDALGIPSTARMSSRLEKE
jgi:transposase-like protein